MPLFNSGAIEVTPAAEAALKSTNCDLKAYLARHQQGDWGEISDRDRRANELAVRHGRQIDSIYKVDDRTELLISTAAARDCTRILLAEEHQRQEVSTQEGYACWAASYNGGENPLIAVEAPRVEALMANLPFTTVLDVGTGTGRHALNFARRGAAVTAVDQSPEMLAVARQAADREGLSIDFQRLSLEKGLPFEPGRFDLLICALMLCHVPDLGQAIKEFYRVLRPGGHLLITDFHPEVVQMGWRTFFDRPGITYLFPNISHTRTDYLESVMTNGFTVQDVLDVPLKACPDGLLSEAVIREHGDRLFCLILFAHK